MKKKPYYKVIIIGFLLFYLFSMILSTYFVTNRFKQEYKYALQELISDTADMLAFGDPKYEYPGYTASSTVWYVSTEDIFEQIGDKYQQFSMALYYNDYQEKTAQASSCIYLRKPMAQGGWESYLYSLSDYLTREEMIDLAKFCESLYPIVGVMWNVIIYVEERTYQLQSIEVNYQTREKEGGDWILSDSAWTWETSNPVEKKIRMQYTSSAGQNLIMPYLVAGVEQYTKWIDNEFLHGFPDKWEETPEESQTLFTTNKEYVDPLFTQSYSLRIRSSSQPLLAAMDYLTYVYIAGFVLTVACIIIIIYFTNKSYKQRVLLEESKRESTNNIANQFNIPLEAIREYSEKLQEDVAPEERERYLDKIINMTENMNDRVQEMIDCSKKDME